MKPLKAKGQSSDTRTYHPGMAQSFHKRFTFLNGPVKPQILNGAIKNNWHSVAIENRDPIRGAHDDGASMELAVPIRGYPRVETPLVFFKLCT